MQVKKEHTSETKVKLTLSADDKVLGPIKDAAVQKLGVSTNLPGFRAGKAPAHLIEKNLDQQTLQTEVLQHALDEMFNKAVQSEKLRPVGPPKASITKFVPYTTLEFEAEVEVFGNVKLPNYKIIKKTLPKAVATAEDIKNVIENLRKQSAETKDVSRPAKNNDKVVIDFKGTDSKGKVVNGADGKDYPLMLGSNTFIPGFEENLIGVKSGQKKKFTLTFPKDYGVKALANKKVTFEVNVKKVQKLVLPKLDDTFAGKLGPFKTVNDLKDDIKGQLVIEKGKKIQQEFENTLLKEIVDKSEVSLPEMLVNEQVEALLREVRQNVAYRGMTYEEMLKSEGKTDEQYREQILQPEAEWRVKTGLVLAEIASEEKLQVTEEELAERIEQLKTEHKDTAMLTELDKPEVQRDIASRIITEKTVNKLVGYATKK